MRLVIGSGLAAKVKQNKRESKLSRPSFGLAVIKKSAAVKGDSEQSNKRKSTPATPKPRDGKHDETSKMNPMSLVYMQSSEQHSIISLLTPFLTSASVCTDSSLSGIQAFDVNSVDADPIGRNEAGGQRHEEINEVTAQQTVSGDSEERPRVAN